MLFRNLYWSHPREMGQASMQQLCLHSPNSEPRAVGKLPGISHLSGATSRKS